MLLDHFPSPPSKQSSFSLSKITTLSGSRPKLLLKSRNPRSKGSFGKKLFVSSDSQKRSSSTTELNSPPLFFKISATGERLTSVSRPRNTHKATVKPSWWTRWSWTTLRRNLKAMKELGQMNYPVYFGLIEWLHALQPEDCPFHSIMESTLSFQPILECLTS